jgi:hypothetical protein
MTERNLSPERNYLREEGLILLTVSEVSVHHAGKAWQSRAAHIM